MKKVSYIIVVMILISMLTGCTIIESEIGKDSMAISEPVKADIVKTIDETEPEPYTETKQEGIDSEDLNLYVAFSEDGEATIVDRTGTAVAGYSYKDKSIKQGRKVIVPESGVLEFKYTEEIVSLMDTPYIVALKQKNDGTDIYKFTEQSYTYEVYATPADATIKGIRVISDAPQIAEVIAVNKGKPGNGTGIIYDITVTVKQEGIATLIVTSEDENVTVRLPVEVTSSGIDEPDNSNNDLIPTTTNTIVYVTNTAANFRREPDLKSNVISILSPDEAVILLGQNNIGWAKVVVNNQIGYVKATSLTYTKPVKVQQQEAQGIIINPGANISNTSSYIRVQGGPSQISAGNGDNDGQDHGAAYGQATEKQRENSYHKDPEHIHAYEPIESEGIITYMCSCGEVYFGTVAINNEG